MHTYIHTFFSWVDHISLVISIVVLKPEKCGYSIYRGMSQSFEIRGGKKRKYNQVMLTKKGCVSQLNTLGSKWTNFHFVFSFQDVCRWIPSSVAAWKKERISWSCFQTAPPQLLSAVFHRLCSRDCKLLK